jgi:cytosine/adenosine deaminase-related metal-dependent hydrolase
MNFVCGEILTKNGFQIGYLGFEGGKITEIGNGSCPKKPISKGFIVPSFVNVHTHIGDSFIRNKKSTFPKDIKKLVAPPNGLKHRLLSEVPESILIRGMKQSIYLMLKNGTKIFYDFRENGLYGINCLKKAIESSGISSIILSRPLNCIFKKNHIKLLIDNSDGIGISSISDGDYNEIKKIADYTKSRNKIFAIHGSEMIREDINLLLDLKPDFIVHMVKANKSDFEIVKDNKIPIVICPRSNDFFNLRPNIKLMKKIGINILIGTDNAMINSPNIIDEIMFCLRNFKEFSINELLYSVTYISRKVLNLKCDILSPNSRAEFVVLDKKTLKPLYVSF